MTLNAYDAYGAGASTANRLALSGYDGERLEHTSGWYLLGSRPYSPVLRRFLAPDATSPFDKGGFNRYAYCGGDPVNRIDPRGESWLDWLAAGISLVFATVATVFSAGALAGTYVAAGSLTAATATPGIVAATVTAVADVVALTATVGSTVGMATRQQELTNVFGWVGTGAGVVSGVSMLTAVKQGASFGKNLAPPSGAPKALSATKPQPLSGPGGASASTRGTAAGSIGNFIESSLETMLRTARFATDATRQASFITNKRTIVVPDQGADRSNMRSMLQRAGSDGATSVNIISGRPRSSLPNRGRRDGAERPHFRGDVRHAAFQGAPQGVQVSVEQIDGLTPEQTRARAASMGIDIADSGFGLIDDTLLEVLNFAEAISGGLHWMRAST